MGCWCAAGCMQVLDDAAAACLPAFLPRDLREYLRLRCSHSQAASPSLRAVLAEHWLSPDAPSERLALGHAAKALPLLLPSMVDERFTSQLSARV